MKKLSIVLISIILITLFANHNVFAATQGELISMSLINQDPDPAIAGDIVELRLGIKNIGSETYENLVVEIVPSYPFSALSGESLIQEVGDISAYQTGENTKIVKFKIKINNEASAGTHEIIVSTYKNGQKDSTSITKLLNLDVKSQDNAEVIYIDQVQLLPGEITPMTFTINNVGSSPLRNLKFYWENDDEVILPVGSDDTKYISYLGVGESKEILYYVVASANAEPDLYKLDLSLTYDNSVTGESEEITTRAGVYIGGQTDFDITYSGNTNGETSFSISNIGIVPANSVTISIPNQEGWKVSGINSAIIGNLNQGDYTVAGFTIQQLIIQSDEEKDSTKPGTFPSKTTQQSSIKVQVVYTDTRGIRQTVIKEVTVDTSSSTLTTFVPGSRKVIEEQGGVNYTGWVIFGTVIVILGLFYKKHKQNKKKDNSYDMKRTFLEIFKKKGKKR